MARFPGLSTLVAHHPTDEEANFIFDVLADPDARAPMLAYARWLEERGEPLAAEFLRLELSPYDNEQRLKALRQQLDPRWLGVVTSRRFRRGDVVRITGGQFEGMEGSVMEVDAPHGRAGLWLHIFYTPRELSWVAFTDLRLVRRAIMVNSE
jgi:uncharacterized protein (TIGR02996 family)